MQRSLPVNGYLAILSLIFTMAESVDIDLANWMSRLPSNHLDLPLNEIAIPGSHDSFSYGLNPTSEIGPDVSDALRTFGQMAKGVIYKWSVTQNQSLYEQLQTGIRYFDFRVALNKSTGKLHFVHGLFGKTVQEEFSEIKRFLDEHNKEVVILDFNHFYSMTDSHHQDLVNSIMQIFENKICLCVGVENLTLNMLWENNFQVIVIYHHKIAEETCEIWPGCKCIQAPWPNTPSISKMIEYLNSTHTQNRGDNFHVSQGILTPDTGYILGHLSGSLKNDIGKKAMPALTDWLANKKPGSKGVNIVIADFTDLCDFTRKMIALNYSRRF